VEVKRRLGEVREGQGRQRGLETTKKLKSKLSNVKRVLTFQQDSKVGSGEWHRASAHLQLNAHPLEGYNFRHSSSNPPLAGFNLN
jgi:hypothetical protein